MAHPWLFEANFEDGTSGEWDSDTVNTLLDFPHYTTLAAIPGGGLPFRGAYCMRVAMGDANDHTVTEGDMDITTGNTAWTRFYLFLAKDVDATSDDTINIFEIQETGNAVEFAIGLRFTAATDAIELGIGVVTPTVFGTTLLERDRWYAIEASFAIDTAATNGAATVFLDGGSHATISSIQATGAITHGVLGTQLTLSTTTGTILFDQFVFDDLQIFPFKRRFVEQLLVTATNEHVFVGNGKIENVTLLGPDNADGVLTIYDTDEADTNDASNIIVELRNTAGDEVVDPASLPARVTRGAYVTLSGTGTRGSRALVSICAAQGWGSDGAIRNYAARRTG